MTDQLNWDDQRSHSPATPGDATANNGGSLQSDVSIPKPTAQNPGAGDGVSMASLGDAGAHEANTIHSPTTDGDWASPGDAVLTTNEARLFLYKHHDMLLRERRVQKLVSETGELDGRRVPKPDGGVQLLITQSSLDRYALQNPEKKNAADIPLDPADKLFEQLRVIAQSKPYSYSILGGAGSVRATPIETPPPAPSSTQQTPPPVPEQKPEIQTPAQGDATTRQGVPLVDMVTREMYELAMSNADFAKQLFQEERQKREAERTANQTERTELIDDLGKAYNKIADMNQALMELAQQQPAQIYAGINDLLHGMGNPNQPKLIPADQTKPHPTTRYSETTDQ